ncbi:MAG: DUF4129 domain-containing protein [Bacteroidetes bacterium]|nr:DUF4129 domain-containing protein [Bacteroidota bacterium]
MEELLTLAEDKGFPRASSETPKEYQGTLERLFPPRLVQMATAAFAQACYGHQPVARDQIEEMLNTRYPRLKSEYVDAIARLTVEINTSFEAQDTEVRVETPLSLRSALDRLPTGLLIFADRNDPLRHAWEDFVLPHVDLFDRDHYETVWNAVVRTGPSVSPY